MNDDETSQVEVVWPPPVVAAVASVSEQDPKRQRRVRMVRLLGHCVALLPIVAFLFGYFWLGLGRYDTDLNLVAPTWYIHLGGDHTPANFLPACLIGGTASIIAGIRMRQWLPVCEGVWACVSVPVLGIMFAIAND